MWREESQPWAFPTHPNSHEWLLLQEEPESCISHNVTLFSLQSYKHQIPLSLSKLLSGIIPCNWSHCAKDLREITVLATERGKAWPNSCTCIVRLPCPSLHFHVPSGVSNSLLTAREPIPLSSHSYHLPPDFCLLQMDTSKLKALQSKRTSSTWWQHHHIWCLWLYVSQVLNGAHEIQDQKHFCIIREDQDSFPSSLLSVAAHWYIEFQTPSKETL